MKKLQVQHIWTKTITRAKIWVENLVRTSHLEEKTQVHAVLGWKFCQAQILISPKFEQKPGTRKKFISPTNVDENIASPPNVGEKNHKTNLPLTFAKMGK